MKTTVISPFVISRFYLAALCAALIACGGGGSGGSATSNSAPIVNTSGNVTAVKGDPVSLNASNSTDPDGDALTYLWSLSRPLGSTANLNATNVANVSFTSDITGTYIATVTVTDGKGGSGTATITVTVVNNSPPVAAASATATSVIEKSPVYLNAGGSSDINNDAITYVWSISSKPAGSAATLSSTSIVNPTFTADKVGSYTVQLTVTDARGANASTSIVITAAANTLPVASASGPATAFTNTTVNISDANSSDANGDALTYAWTLFAKPASSAALLTNTAGSMTSFSPDLPGSYTVRLFVTDARGGTSAAPSDVTVVVSNSTAIVNNSFSVACTGSNCGALSANSYSGSGVGVWRYNNTNTTAANVNIDISGVSAGKIVSLVFTNGNATDILQITPAVGTQASTEPLPKSLNPAISAGLLPPSPSKHAQRLIHDHHEAAHSNMLNKNHALKSQLKQANSKVSASILPPKPAFATPAVNATRTWQDYYEATPVAYATTNKFVCSMGGGRNVVFWVDNNDTNITPAILTSFTNAVCGANGGFDRLRTLIGEPWGSHQFGTQLITETTANKLDLNIVFAKTAASTAWAGYFYGRNNFLSTLSTPSNEALLFFINTNNIFANNYSYYVSTLIHEATHLFDYYQNDIARLKDSQTWMTESYAMMSEDIVTPAVASYNKIAEYRLPGYLLSKGNISLNNWSTLSADHYNMGGSFSAYLNRQYGINIFKQLTSLCTTGTAKTNSYDCLNAVLANNGGSTVAEELARMGSAVFSKTPSTGAPSQFGFPQKVDSGYTLQAIDLTPIPAAANALGSNFNSMSHTYLNETIAAGKTRYIRNGVVVPPGGRLQVVIQ